jgi:hypothetical protein
MHSKHDFKHPNLPAFSITARYSTDGADSGTCYGAFQVPALLGAQLLDHDTRVLSTRHEQYQDGSRTLEEGIASARAPTGHLPVRTKTRRQTIMNDETKGCSA